MNNFYEKCHFINECNQPLDNFARRVEEGSRYLIEKYITSDMKVLELGARYGTVSVCLDFILNEPKNQLVCVDPDPNTKECLLYNKNINNCSFNIFSGAISSNNLYVCHNGCGWETKTYINPPTNLSCQKIQTLSLEEIQNMYNIQFNCLLADCEGFLLQFIQENENLFDNLKCLIYEEDCGKNHPINGTYIDYNEVESFLLSKGYELIETYIDFIGLSNKVWIKL